MTGNDDARIGILTSLGVPPSPETADQSVGPIILSGLLLGDVPGVVSAYRRQGLVLVRRRSIEGWATLLMRRPVSSG